MEVGRKVAIDTIVKKYLLSNGYEDAAAAMSAKNAAMGDTTTSNADSDPIANDSHISSGNSNTIIDEGETLTISGQILSTVVEDIVILGVNSGNYSIYEEEYCSLRSWSLSSLDIVKSEVSLFLFPAFVHW